MAKKACAFTWVAGRQIYKHGKPFISIGREGSTAPWDADAVGRKITRLLCSPAASRVSDELFGARRGR